MTPNQKIEYHLFYFKDPYNSEKINHLITKIESSKKFNSEQLDDLKEQLKLKEHTEELRLTYKQSHAILIEKLIDQIKNSDNIPRMKDSMELDEGKTLCMVCDRIIMSHQFHDHFQIHTEEELEN